MNCKIKVQKLIYSKNLLSCNLMICNFVYWHKKYCQGQSGSLFLFHQNSLDCRVRSIEENRLTYFLFTKQHPDINSSKCFTYYGRYCKIVILRRLRLKLRKYSINDQSSFTKDFLKWLFLYVAFLGRGSERRRSERWQAKNFRTLKWSF
jgi:hypothetical protein